MWNVGLIEWNSSFVHMENDTLFPLLSSGVTILFDILILQLYVDYIIHLINYDIVLFNHYHATEILYNWHSI